MRVRVHICVCMCVRVFDSSIDLDQSVDLNLDLDLDLDLDLNLDVDLDVDQPTNRRTNQLRPRLTWIGQRTYLNLERSSSTFVYFLFWFRALGLSRQGNPLEVLYETLHTKASLVLATGPSKGQRVDSTKNAWMAA